MDIGPDLLDAGDIIVLFSGAAVPFILPEVSADTFKLVVECHVHSIMDGEGFNSEFAWKQMFQLV